MTKIIRKYDPKGNIEFNEVDLDNNGKACEAIEKINKDVNKKTKDTWLDKIFGDYENNPFTIRADLFGIAEKDRIDRKLDRVSNISLAQIGMAIDTKDETYTGLSKPDQKSEMAKTKKVRLAYSTLYLERQKLHSFCKRNEWRWNTFEDMVRAYKRDDNNNLKLGRTKPDVMQYLPDMAKILDKVSFDIEDPKKVGEPLKEISEQSGEEVKCKDHFTDAEKIQLFQMVGLSKLSKEIQQFANLLETNPDACLVFLANHVEEEEEIEEPKDGTNG